MTATKLTVLECGHTTLDFELVATGHPDKNIARHLMPCTHGPDASGKIAPPICAYVIQHPDGRILPRRDSKIIARDETQACGFRIEDLLAAYD